MSDNVAELRGWLKKKDDAVWFTFFVSEKVPHNVAVRSKENVDLNFVICQIKLDLNLGRSFSI